METLSAGFALGVAGTIGGLLAALYLATRQAMVEDPSDRDHEGV